MTQQRTFSGGARSKNLLYLKSPVRPDDAGYRVGFLLLEHFSLAAFTASLDTLVTANLIEAGRYQVRTFGLGTEQVLSDLGILIQVDALLDGAALGQIDRLMVCGGFRTPLRVDPVLEKLLHDTGRRGLELGGLWNGAWFLAHCGLLDGYRCAVHPENRASLGEARVRVGVTPASYVIDRDRATAASPNGSFAMMLELIRLRHGDSLAQGVEQILAFEGLRFRRIGSAQAQKLTEPLRNAIDLMENNLEEPLELDRLADYVGRSRRQIDRLFQDQLGTSPHRYYLELRITESRRLLQHSRLSIMDVAVACGFVSVSHFSKCYSGYFGYPPSREQRLAD